jgi:AspT/YidE/YbjL antiporter-like protein
MNWLFQLHTTQPVAQAIGILAIVCVAGMAIGSVTVRGIGLGTAGVLFAGLITGHFSKPVDHATLDFVKEFGLLLFVFTIGLQLGPGFFSALRRDGLKLNALALLIIFSGTAIAVLCGRLFRLDSAAVLGVLSGAVTNTPSLGAAQQALSTSSMPNERLALPALAYAVTYPVAIVGIIGSLLALKGLFHIDPPKEAEALATERTRLVDPVETRTPVVENPHSARMDEREIVVTREAVLGKTLRELSLDARYGVVISRLTRADVALPVGPEMSLEFGDVVKAVGEKPSLDLTEALLGNSIKALGETRFIPLFLGIVLGIIAGTVPIVVPGLPQALKLGLAGGPLVVALVLGRLGHIGRLVFYMPVTTNLAFRQFGIALFFAAVGLSAGPTFFSAVFSTAGLLWLVVGACVAVLPLLLTGVFARLALHMNFAVLGGVIAGSMTDPPALTFVNNLTRSEISMLSYVTVYPLTTLLRILAAQVLALSLIR